MKMILQAILWIFVGTSVFAQGLNSVTVITNQTDHRVSYWFFPDTSRQQIKEAKTLPPGESIALPNPEGRGCIVFQHDGKPAKVMLRPDHIHAFSCPEKTLELHRIGPVYPEILKSFPAPVLPAEKLREALFVLTKH